MKKIFLCFCEEFGKDIDIGELKIWTAWTKIAVTEFDEFVESYYDYYAIIAIPNEMYRDFQILLESEL